MRLEGKVAVVTGASSGMGRAIALLFAKEGAKVVAVARRKERLEEIAQQAPAGSIIPVQGDMGKKEDIENMIEQAVSQFGKLDILVNNAGIMDDFTPAGDVSDDLWERVININLTGPFRAVRKALDYMLKQGSGTIVNVASIGGLFGSRAGAAYTASKHGLVGFTKNTAFMYGDKGIRSNVICPGGVATEIVENMTNVHPYGAQKAQSGTAGNIRMGSSEEIANIALFLASDESSLVNGATLVADAGWTAY